MRQSETGRSWKRSPAADTREIYRRKNGRAIEVSNRPGIYDRPSLTRFIIPFDVSATARLEEWDSNDPFTKLIFEAIP